MATTGAGVAGVRIRGMPMALNDGRAPGPDVLAVTDDRGAYTISVLTWTLEALANSSSFQLVLEITPPPGFLVAEVTKSLGGLGLGGSAFMLGDLDGPIDIALGPGHVIEGKITSGLTGGPLAGFPVYALRLNSMLIYGGVGDAFEIEAIASVDSTGTYALTVPAGTYVIHTAGPQGGQPRFWSDDPTVFQATPLTVERDIAGIDLALVPVTEIGGHVQSGPTQYVDGVAGARVAAYRAGGTSCCHLVGMATTGYGGTFRMYLPQGTYRIVFDPPAGSPYAPQWWARAPGFATATDLTVGPTSPIELEVELLRT